jgi:hypothetical protein
VTEAVPRPERLRDRSRLHRRSHVAGQLAWIEWHAERRMAEDDRLVGPVHRRLVLLLERRCRMVAERNHPSAGRLFGVVISLRTNC